MVCPRVWAFHPGRYRKLSGDGDLGLFWEPAGLAVRPP